MYKRQSHDSNAVLMLFDILSGFGPVDQRRFVLFLTGSPALRLVGLKNLNPPLTIVRRHREGCLTPYDCLPTVITCANYFKLPDYRYISRNNILGTIWVLVESHTNNGVVERRFINSRIRRGTTSSTESRL